MKLPKEAKKVFQGKIFSVYQWEQILFDGSKAVFERAKRPATVGIIPVTTDKKILLLKEVQPDRLPFITVAGGKVDAGEEPMEAVKRELLEETGFTAGDIFLWKEVQPASKIDWNIYTYIAKDCKKIQEPKLEAGEKIEVELVDFDRFVEIVSQEDFYGRAIAMEVLRLRLDLQKLEEFKKLLLD